MSEHNIAPGERWRQIIDIALQTDFGIVCLTKDSLDSPWLHFEAGTLAKAMTQSRVCPFLFKLKPTDVREPLAAFQSVIAGRVGALAIIRTINSAVEEDRRLADQHLDDAFDKWWPDLKKSLAAVDESSVEAPTRTMEDMQEETLSTVRRIAAFLARQGSISRVSSSVSGSQSGPSTVSRSSESSISFSGPSSSSTSSVSSSSSSNEGE